MHKIRPHLRSIAFAGILLLMLTETVCCYALPKSRYLKVASNSAYNYYLDTETVRYIRDPYLDEQLIDAWLKITAADDISNTELENQQVTENNRFGYSVRRYYFRLKERQMQLLTLQDFSTNGTPLNSEKYTYAAVRWDDIAPNTLGEVWYGKIRTYLESKQNLNSIQKK